MRAGRSASTAVQGQARSLIRRCAPPSPGGRRDQQRGVALITAILVVALATIAASAILVSAHVAIYRANNLQSSEKAWWYADGIESWVKSILVRDRNDNQHDSWEDKWATDVGILPVDEGVLRGEVIDQQGLFNLNNLAVKDAQQYQKYLEHFQRLAQALDIDAALARDIATAIRDWADADDQPSGLGGAEDTDYLSLQPPYRTANRYLESVSELLAIRGVTPEIYRKLTGGCSARGRPLPCVTALPWLNTAININTAPEAVLRAMVKQANPQFESFLRDREQNPSTNAQSQQSAFEALSPPQTVSSQFFMLQAEALIGSGRVALYSFYYRPSAGAPVVLGRSTDTP